MNKGTIGIDIGTTQLRMTIQEEQGSRSAVREATPELYEEGELIPSKAAQLLEGMREELNIKPRSVCNSTISDKQAIIRTIRLPKMSHSELLQALPYELEQLLPFAASEMNTDGIELVTSEDGKTQLTAVVAASKTEIEHHRAIIEAAGLFVQRIEPRAQAMLRRFNQHHLSKGNFSQGSNVMLDIGSSSSTLLITSNKEGKLINVSMRVLPIGGDSITEEISHSLGKTFQEAEDYKLKLEEANKDNDLKISKEIIRVHSTRLSHEIEGSTDAHLMQGGEKPTELMLCGGGSLLEQTRAQLESSLKLPIKTVLGRLTISEGAALSAHPQGTTVRKGKSHA